MNELFHDAVMQRRGNGFSILKRHHWKEQDLSTPHRKYAGVPVEMTRTQE